MEKRTFEITMPLLWKVLKRSFLILLAVGILAFALMFTYLTLSFDPQFESTGGMFILREAEGGGDDDNGYVVSDMMLVTCQEWVTTRTVLQAAIDELKLDMSWEELRECVTTEMSEESRILKVTVVAESPGLAKELVDKICRIADQKMEEVSGERHARFFEDGEINEEPCNRPSVFLMIVLSIAVMAVGYILLVAVYVAQDYIGSNEDLEKRFGLPVLGDLPNLGQRGKGKYKRYYNAYVPSQTNPSQEVSQ